MDEELKQKTLHRLDAMNDYEWVSLVRYFAPKMVDEQGLLAEAVCRRAQKQADAINKESELVVGYRPLRASDRIAGLMLECGLMIENIE